MNAEAPLFRLLTQRVDTLSRNQRVLAKYVMANYQTVAFSTITQLAEHSGVSESTIVRFAKALDFGGYPAFQKEIRRIVRADLKGTERFRLSDTARESRDGPLDAIIAKEIENTVYLRESFDPKRFGEAVEAIAHASQVLVVGARSTASLAHHLCFGLGKIGVAVIRLPSVDSEAYDQVNRLDERALVVVIGFPRYLRAQVELLEFARARRLRTLVITDSPFSPLAADMHLYAPAESTSFVAFHAAPLILINALLHAVSQVDQDKTLDSLRRFEQLAEASGYFHHG